MIAVVGLGGCVAVSPWFFGSVQPKVQVWLLMVLGATMVPALLLAILRGPRSNLGKVSVLTLPLILAAVVGSAQLVPLPAELLDSLSPNGSDFWQLAKVTESNGSAGSQSDSAGGVRYPVSLYPASTRRDLAMLGLPVGAFILASLTITTRRAQIGLFAIIAVNGALLAIFGIVQQLTFNGKLFWSVPLRQGGEPFASFVNRNHAGGYLNMCLAASLAILVWSVTRRQPIDGQDPDDLDEAYALGGVARRWTAGWLASLDGLSLLVIALTILAAAGVVCSLSRGAILALVCAGSVSTIVAIKMRGAKSIAGVAALFLLIGVGLSLWLGRGELLQERLTETVTDIEMSQSSRIDHWQDVLAVCRDFWMTGSGIGTYRYVYRPYETQVASGWFFHAENQYLESFVETGVIGLLLIFSCIALATVASLRLMQWRRDPFAFAIGIAGLFAISSQAVHSFFDFGLYMPSNALLLAIMMGCCCAKVPPAESTDDMWVTPTSSFSRLLHVGVCLFGIAWVGWGIVVTAENSGVASAIETAKEFDESVPCDPAELNQSIARLEHVLSTTQSSDADARVSLARLYVLKYRQQAYSRLISENASSEGEKKAVWQMTSPLLLNRRAHQLRRTDEVAFEELTSQPPVSGFLRPALEQLRIASCCCPVLGKSRMRLAQLSVVAAEEFDEMAEIQTAVRLAPNNPGVLFRCGMLDIHAGRQAPGLAKLKKSLSISTEFLDETLALLGGLVSRDQILASAIPDSPERIVEIAYRVESRGMQVRLADRAAEMMQNFPLEPANEEYLFAAVAKMRSEFSEALRRYKTAVDLAPENHRWRHEFATLLTEQGLLSDAHRHASICVRQMPGIPAYRLLLKRINELRRRQNSQSP